MKLRKENLKPRPLILAVDKGGRPAEWINWQKAASHYLGGDVMWTVGEPAIVLHGGVNKFGVQSTLELHPVIALGGADASVYEKSSISLSNQALFARDRHICMYCGVQYHKSHLSRDHVVPQARGGPDVWENVVTSCKPCNHRKACKTPDEAGLELLALPFAPSHIEGLLLSNKRVLTDQMDYLLAQRPNSRKSLN